MTIQVGLLGGTFDPVHMGHLVLADQCRDQAALDEVWFVPARIPPHKGGKQITEPRHRLEMLRIAISGTPWFSLCEIELDRDGPSYTVDTLSRLREKHADHEFSLLVGADMLLDFPNWREPERIASMCRLIAVNRGGEDGDVQSAANELKRSLNADARVLSIPAIDISATDIRRRVSEGRSIRFLTPRGVEMYIAAQGLYGKLSSPRATGDGTV
jgi:nicotinate-nucleotide adenylyltransferase